jgi:hypothetical protein
LKNRSGFSKKEDVIAGFEWVHSGKLGFSYSVKGFSIFWIGFLINRERNTLMNTAILITVYLDTIYEIW